MKVLQLHTDFFEYQPIAKEIDLAEDTSPGTVRLEDVVVLFTTIESDDDDEVAGRSYLEAKESMAKLGVSKVLIYPYSHLSSELARPEHAIRVLKKLHEVFQKSGMDVHSAPFGWNKSFTLKVKGHPLAEQYRALKIGAAVGEATISSALKADEKLVSSWFIIDPNGGLTPVGEYDFSRSPKLELLAKYEMAKVRAVAETPPHVALMKRLGLVDYEPASDRGNFRFYPSGRLIKSLIEQLVTDMVKRYGGVEVETPIMYDFDHPALADYLDRFPARQYALRSDDKEYFLRFSACFGQFLMVKDAQLSYKQLPYRLYELTRYSFRREKSGELTGLRRLRAFTMPDCHALCADIDQAKEEAMLRIDLSIRILSEIGLEREDYELAVRVTDDFYRENTNFIRGLVVALGKPALMEMWRERPFYFVMKWEFNFIDSLGKASALSTDQIDVENAKRYGIKYVDSNGSERYPMILHNSPSGAVERCIYALLEKAYMRQQEGGVPSLPLWLSPVQVRFIPVSVQYTEFCISLAEQLAADKIRADADDRDASVDRKVRDAERQWIPMICVVGSKEQNRGKLSVRVRELGKLVEMSVDELREMVRSAVQAKPWAPLPHQYLLSKSVPYS